jgi:hypothetical protein
MEKRINLFHSVLSVIDTAALSVIYTMALCCTVALPCMFMSWGTRIVVQYGDVIGTVFGLFMLTIAMMGVTKDQIEAILTGLYSMKEYKKFIYKVNNPVYWFLCGMGWIGIMMLISAHNNAPHGTLFYSMWTGSIINMVLCLFCICISQKQSK